MDAQLFRSMVMRAPYLAQGQQELCYASKEAARLLSTPCELGHYAHPGGDLEAHRGIPYLECMAYYAGNYSSDGASLVVEPLPFVTPVDDNDFLVDQFESLLERGLAAKKPVLSFIFFHGVHIPYVATPEMRAVYTATTNPRTGVAFTEKMMCVGSVFLPIARGSVRLIVRPL